MLTVIEPALIAVVLALMLLAPGAAMLQLSGSAGVIGPYLILPASLLTTLLLNSAVFGIALGVGAGMGTMRLVWLGIATGLIVAWFTRSLYQDRAMGALIVRARTYARRWAMEIGPWLLCACAAAAIAAFAAGTIFRGDLLYHLAHALKILELDIATLENTGRLVDGDANPAYYIPTGQATLALGASLTGQHPGAIAELMGVTLVPLAILAYAGLAAVLLRSAAGATIAGTAYALIAIAVTTPHLLPIRGATFPGNIVLDIVLPMIPALAYRATFERSSRWHLHGVLAIASLLVVILHANYVLYLGLHMLAMFIGALATYRSKFPTRAAIATAVSTVGVATVSLAMLMPVLRRLSHFGEAPGDSDGVGMFERFGTLFVGDPQSFHLLPGQLYMYGGIVMLGTLLAGGLMLWKPREPAAWFASSLTLLLVVVTQWDWLFMELLGSGSISVMLRIGRIAPASLAIACVLLWTWQLLERRGHSWRSLVALSAVTAVSVGVLTHLYPYGLRSFAATNVDETYPNWPLYASSILACAGLIRGLVSRGDDLYAPQRALPRVSRAPYLLAGALVIGLAAPISQAGQHLWPELTTRLRGDRFELVDGVDRRVIDALSALPAGSVVLAPPKPAYAIPAQVPVYVVGDFKYWLAATAANSPEERLHIVETFYADSSPDAQRDLIICDWRPDAVVIPRGHRAARRYVDDPERLAADRRPASQQAEVAVLRWSDVRRAERECGAPPHGRAR